MTSSLFKARESVTGIDLEAVRTTFLLDHVSLLARLFFGRRYLGPIESLFQQLGSLALHALRYSHLATSLGRVSLVEGKTAVTSLFSWGVPLQLGPRGSLNLRAGKRVFRVDILSVAANAPVYRNAPKRNRTLAFTLKPTRVLKEEAALTGKAGDGEGHAVGSIAAKNGREAPILFTEEEREVFLRYIKQCEKSDALLFLHRKEYFTRVPLETAERRFGVCITSHCLRHTYATRLLEAGIPIDILRGFWDANPFRQPASMRRRAWREACPYHPNIPVPVLKNFTWERAAKLTLEVYSKVLEGNL